MFVLRFLKSHLFPDYNYTKYHYYVSLTLIGFSLILQVIVAIALIFKSRMDIEEQAKYDYDNLEYSIIVGVCLITIANVVLSAFAPVVPGMLPEALPAAKPTS